MKNNLNKKIDEIFQEVGEFGPYQLFIFCLVGMTAFIPSIVGYSYSFIGATPNHRCKIPNLDNDTYEIANDYHQLLVNKYIPIPKEKTFKNEYEKCFIRIFSENFTINQAGNESTDFKLVKCDQWVYSKKYLNETLMTNWNLVCDDSSKRSIFATLYFVGTYGVLLNGVLSDKFGRKNAAYIFIVANASLNILLTILLNTNSIDLNIQFILFGIIRFFTGIASNVYAVAVVLAVEICGTSHRVTAANFIYYFYILGEFIVVLLAYLLKNNYQILYACYTAIMCSLILYFWIVPESPRWLMTKNKFGRAGIIFKRIASSNKRSFSGLNESFNILNRTVPKYTENTAGETLVANEDQETEKILSVTQTIKIFFKTKRIIIRSLVTLINWLTNTLVYYGISFNTADLAGDPYLNFFLSVLVELFAIIMCHLTLERFGRKIPYALNMLLTGISLLLIQFVPADIPVMVTILALIGKFAISFTYNAIYIITAEIYPTVIRNSSVSICQSFARIGAVLAPNIQLLGDLYWYPFPFLIYGSFSTLSAISFIIFMPETKKEKLPDTIEEFLQ